MIKNFGSHIYFYVWLFALAGVAVIALVRLFKDSDSGVQEDIETAQAIKEDLSRILSGATMLKEEAEFLKKKLEKIKKKLKRNYNEN